MAKDVAGLQIVEAGHVTRLKWHRLRRSLADPEFAAVVMAEGFKIGASMELDLQVRGDGGFVVLHDPTLDRETTGTGAVALHTGAQLSALRYRSQDAGLILSEDLAGLLTLAHPDALLQFDMKNTFEEVGPTGLAHFAAQFSNLRANIILSGGSIPLIRALVEQSPLIQRGYDPTDDLLEIWPVHGLGGVERALIAVLRDQIKPDMVYLQWEMVLSAADLGLDMVALAHAEGVKIDAWTHRMQNPSVGFTPAEGEDFAKLLALKPDQITTDEPIATEAAWAAWRAL